MGAGFNAAVYGMGVVNGQMYVGGEFTMSGSVALRHIAQWNGSAWVDPGFGIYYTVPGVHPFVHTIQQIGTRGVFEGGFDRVVVGPDTFIANNVIALNGISIDTLADGIPNANFEGLAPYGASSSILVGSATFPGGGPEATNVSKYDFSNTGINIIRSNSVTVYPNPFSDFISIEHAEADSEIKIFNILGELIKQEKTVGSANTLDLESLQPGVYILQVQDKSAISRQTIFKQ